MSGKAGQITRVAGNNRQACFFAEEDSIFYLDWLAEYAKTGCLVHAFVLMTNHVHLLLTPEKAKSAGDLMKRLHKRGLSRMALV